MAAFHETMRGARFFDADVPRIAKSLQSIAESLAKIAKAMEEDRQDSPGK